MAVTMTNAEKAMHLETAPRKFVERRGASEATASSRRLERMLHEAESLTKKDALKLAQTLLVHVYADGVSYADVEAAKATTKYVGQAIRALRGLPLA